MENSLKYGYKKLSGNAKDRRKQLRKLRREYPDYILEGKYVFKKIDGKRVAAEEANVPRTKVVLRVMGEESVY